MGEEKFTNELMKEIRAFRLSSEAKLDDRKAELSEVKADVAERKTDVANLKAVVE